MKFYQFFPDMKFYQFLFQSYYFLKYTTHDYHMSDTYLSIQKIYSRMSSFIA